MKPAILVPRRAGVADRDRLWAFTRQWWASQFPDWPIVEGHHDDGPFNRSAAVNRAAAEAGPFEVACIIDADVLCDWDAVRRAVDIAAGGQVMVVAGNRRHHLTRAGTRRILAGYRGPWEPFIERTFTRHWSSCVTVGRDLWDRVGGFDEAFAGWGYEDDAFKHACETMSGRAMRRLDAPIWHLWHDRAPDPPTQRANRERADRYKAAAGDPEAMGRLIAEARPAPTGIPPILHRTVPADTTPEVEAWWGRFVALHPGWEHRTWRDPLDPAEFPRTSDLWDRCRSGAQLAGLVRLEVLWWHGGVYVDSDVEPYRSLEPLLGVAGFAAWEDPGCVPDAVMGFGPRHPAVGEMIGLARQRITSRRTHPRTGNGAWATGPGVTTTVLPGRDDVLLLPPGAFYNVHYTDKARLADPPEPFELARHHWRHSWAGT